MWGMGAPRGWLEAEERGPLTLWGKGRRGHGGGSPLTACDLVSGSFFLFCPIGVYPHKVTCTLQ